MTPHPKVSVLIPVYNDQAGIRRCLAALATQSYPRESFEVIIVDNGSDHPVELEPGVTKFARVVPCPIPGAYAARNAGIQAANGEVLAFTDADCVPDSHWIFAGVTALCCGDFRNVLGGEVRLELSPHPSVIEKYQYIVGFMQQENIEHRGFSATANLFVGRAQMERVGPFDESLLSGGDREWCWRAMEAGFPVRYSRDAIVATSPRSTLTGAIRQARRVAGGRHALNALPDSHVKPDGLQRHRSALAAAEWILQHPELSRLDRVKVLGVATIVRLAALLEAIQLRIGTAPQRQ